MSASATLQRVSPAGSGAARRRLMGHSERDAATAPGRVCPARYRYHADALRAVSPFETDTLYVVGGLYGNVEALGEILAMKAAEERAGVHVSLLFNGDFNWFDVDDAGFREVNETVLAHAAILGNIEAELDGDGDVGCGCAYPAYVSQATVERSNAMMQRLRACAARHPALLERLARLPMYAVARIGGERVGIVHGDPESLAGWRLAVENLQPLDRRLRAELGCGAQDPVTTEAEVCRFFEQGDVRVIACTHTCLPFLQDFQVRGERHVVVNNGSAGMGNFRGDQRGVITRISARAGVPASTLYGCRAGGLRIDALPVAFDSTAWERRFLACWPEGSPAHRSYYERIVHGPRFDPAQAARIGNQPTRRSTRSTISPARPV